MPTETVQGLVAGLRRLELTVADAHKAADLIEAAGALAEVAQIVENTAVSEDNGRVSIALDVYGMTCEALAAWHAAVGEVGK